MSNYNIESIRNIGIIAHIDAGKTTVTERILYFTGQKNKVGEVHEGETTTDYLLEERQRGITIVSAAVSCFWNDSQINIIDTPGHVDFSVEVNRSLRVLDGAVVVLCAVSGVEPQTEKVWARSEERRIPKLVFVNKMDRDGADFKKTITNLSSHFNNTILPVTIPIGSAKEFSGYVDIINDRIYTFYEAFEGMSFDEKFNEYSCSLIEAQERKLFGDTLDEVNYIYKPLMLDVIRSKLGSSTGNISKDMKECVVHKQVVPVVCGSALKNRGIKLLLDFVVGFMPNPTDIAVEANDEGIPVNLSSSVDERTTALIFKTINDKFVGQLCAVRIYSGCIRKSSFIYNSTAKQKERISRIVRMHADKREDLEAANAGDIVGILGLKETALTGHTLCEMGSSIVLESIDRLEPLVSASLLLEKEADFVKLSTALNKLKVEDPSLKSFIDQSTNQVIIAGMGMLHLEIAVSRIFNEYGIKVTLQNPEVCYKETITKSAKGIVGKFVKQTGGAGQYGHVVIDVEPIESGFEFVNKVTGGAISEPYIKAVEAKLKLIMEQGLLANYNITGVKVTLITGSEHSVDSSEQAFQSATLLAFRTAFMNHCQPKLLEPFVNICVSTPEEFVGDLVGDFQSRRGDIVSISDHGKFKLITACVPRSTIFSYESELRNITSGRAFTREIVPASYQILPQHLCDEVVKKRTK